MGHKEKILFLRNRPKTFNLGDFLCTPLHYFDFGCHAFESKFFLKNKPHKIVLGGGAFNDLGVNEGVDYAQTVLWGVGSSVHGRESLPTNGNQLPYLLYGLRDPDAVTDTKKILPCVSCLHPLVNIEPGKETAIFLNKDKNVTDISFFQKSSEINSFSKVFSNSLYELEFMKAFSRAGRIITNSYHISYWSLLSGRQVAIIGYSSKFRSLLKLTNLNPENINYYDCKDQNDLKNLLIKINTHGNFLFLKDHILFKKLFINKNLQFAAKCVEIGFVPKVNLKHSTTWRIIRRNLEYKSSQLIRKALKIWN